MKICWQKYSDFAWRMNTQKIERLSSKAGKIREEDKVAVISELRRKYKLAALLELVGMPRSTYYYYVKKSKEPDKYAKIKDEIHAIYHENQGRYGYRRITLELRNRGYCINHKTVQRLMKSIGIKCMVRVKKYRSYKGEVGKIAPNIIQRDFVATAPNQKWTTDITEFSLFWHKNSTFHQYLICSTVKLSAIISVNVQY